MGDELQNTPDGAGTMKAPLRRKWVTFVAIFFVACTGICVWAYLDATWIYPERGEKVAEYTEYAYLNEVGRIEGSLRTASVDDPVGTWDAYRDAPPATDIDTARYFWLEALTRLNKLTPEHTTYADLAAAEARFTELDTSWKTETKPKPLAAYDIPSQWAILAVFAVLAGYNAFLFIRASLQAYIYDPNSHTLTLPCKNSFTPDHIQEIDKRKWDKFKIAITLTDDHPQLGGQTVHFDTYRHDRLEGWILAMEEQAFGPEEDPEGPEGDPDDPGGSDERAGTPGASSPAETAGADTDPDSDPETGRA